MTEYVAACPVCDRNKTSSLAPMGLLQPLPVPQRPWSHISLDFVTGLPPSKGNTTVLTVVDRFTKMVHFILLLKLPSAKETAEVMLRHVFRIHGFCQGHCVRPGPTVNFLFLEGVLPSTWSHRESFIRISPPVQWPVRGHQPGTRDLFALPGLPEPGILEQAPDVGGVRPQHAAHSRRSSVCTASSHLCSLPMRPRSQSHQLTLWSVGSARIWAGARRALLRSASRMKEVVDRRWRPAPLHRPGQRVGYLPRIYPSTSCHGS